MIPSSKPPHATQHRITSKSAFRTHTHARTHTHFHARVPFTTLADKEETRKEVSSELEQGRPQTTSRLVGLLLDHIANATRRVDKAAVASDGVRTVARKAKHAHTHTRIHARLDNQKNGQTAGRSLSRVSHPSSCYKKKNLVNLVVNNNTQRSTPPSETNLSHQTSQEACTNSI